MRPHILLPGTVAAAVLAMAPAAQTCSLVADLHPGSGTAAPNALSAVFGDVLLFSATSGSGGQEPWILEPGAAPRRIADLEPGTGGSDPESFVRLGARVVFTAATRAHGRELWLTDAAGSGAVLVRDLRPGGIGCDPRDLVALGGRVLFVADDGVHGREPWATDGTAAGTVMLRDVAAGAAASGAHGMVRLGDRVLFAADDGIHGEELWISDGTAAGTDLLIDIFPGSPASRPAELVEHDGRVFFAARDAAGVELWASDGTTAGTARIADIVPSGSSFPQRLTAAGTRLFFVAAGPGVGYELFVHDAGGTRLVADIWPGGAGSSPRELVALGDALLCSAHDGVHGVEPWFSDGTAANTRLVADLRPGSGSSYPERMVALGRRAWFAADAGSGPTLWTSDGTAAGTRSPCAGIGSPRELTPCGCDLYFGGYEPGTGIELYAVRAPGANVMVVGRGCGDPGPTLAADPPHLGASATLRAEGGPVGHLAWVVFDTVRQPRQVLPGPGCEAWVQPMLALGPFAAPRFDLPFTVPAVAALDGTCLPVQAWWLPAALPLAVRTSNALLLGLGR